MPIPPRSHNIGTGCGTRTHTPSQASRFERDTAANYVNPVLVDRVGFEPTMFLMSRIYSPLSSPLDTPIHIVYINHPPMASIILVTRAGVEPAIPG